MNCFICNETLTEINASDEHIILNSLGGHLHSKIYCAKSVIVNWEIRRMQH